MTEACVLVIDDDSAIRRLIGIHLQQAGIHYMEADSGSQALVWLERQSFDLLVLDLMMDDTDGIELLKRIRAEHNHTPVIIVSAVHEIEKKIETLGYGADDYVTKPFIPSELVARIQANIRRSRHPSISLDTETLHCGPILLDLNKRTVIKEDQHDVLTQTECDLLATLMSHPGRSFSKEELYRAVWKHDHFDANNLSVYINYLRRKIEDDPKLPQFIITVRGIGYRFQETGR